MSRTFLRIGAAVLAVSIQGAAAGPRRGPPALIGQAPPPLEAAGCYYYRERQYCGRYCYMEVNGRRYCQRFERDAHPQAGFEVPEPGLK